MDIIPIFLAVVLFLITAFITLRVGLVFPRVRSTRLLILGISMGIIALTALADLVGILVNTIELRTDWFLYIGQALALLFILLSLFNSSEKYLQSLLRIHLFISVLLLCLLLLSPTLPDVPDGLIRAVLSGIRCPLCLGISYCYISVFLSKPTRFSGLMGTAFLLLGLGYLLLVQKYFVADAAIFDNIGDFVRMSGLLALLVAVLRG